MNTSASAVQSEFALEKSLVETLQQLNYTFVAIRNETELIANLKRQLEIQNAIEFSASEFEKVLNLLSKGSVFEKPKPCVPNSTFCGIMEIHCISICLTLNTGARISFRSRSRSTWKAPTKTDTT